MSRKIVVAVLAAVLYVPLASFAASVDKAGARSGNGTVDRQQIERGRYLVKIAGCNDCHTPGYAQAGGKVPEAQWLTGDQLGWRGPWGTTYPSNLRLYMRNLSEAQWVTVAKTMKTRPPMPWFVLHDMTEQDLKAIYHYVKVLGPAGEPAPAYVAPDKTPRGPYVQFPAAPN